MERHLWSSPERGHQKETIKKKKTCVLNTLTSGLNPIKWSLWSTLFPECVITSMDILTRTWSPCCSGTSLPRYQVTPVFPEAELGKKAPPQGLGPADRGGWERREGAQGHSTYLGPMPYFNMWHLRTSSNVVSVWEMEAASVMRGVDQWLTLWFIPCV